MSKKKSCCFMLSPMMPPFFSSTPCKETTQGRSVEDVAKSKMASAWIVKQINAAWPKANSTELSG